MQLLRILSTPHAGIPAELAATERDGFDAVYDMDKKIRRMDKSSLSSKHHEHTYQGRCKELHPGLTAHQSPPVMGEIMLVQYLLLAGLTVLLISAAYGLHRLYHTLCRERHENRRLRELIRTGFLEVDSDLEQMRRLRHDLRHYLQVTGGEVVPDTLLTELADVLKRSVTTFGGSWAVSGLSRHYQSLAEAEGFEADLQLENSPVPDFLLPDVCLVLSNLLENAVEALRREGSGWICAKSISANGFLTIIVANSSSTRLHWVNGRCLSSKAEGRFGVGLATVQDIAHKCGGQATFLADGNHFRAQVILSCSAPPCPMTAGDIAMTQAVTDHPAPLANRAHPK